MKHSTLKRLFIPALLLLTLTLLAGCAANTPAPAAIDTTVSATDATPSATAAPTATPTATPAQVTLKTFTAEELAKYDGQNGNPAYVAVNGKVYDVTDVPQWKNGTHAGGRLKAGVDLTEALKQAPHGAEKLNNVPIVGLYQ